MLNELLNLMSDFSLVPSSTRQSIQEEFTPDPNAIPPVGPEFLEHFVRRNMRLVRSHLQLPISYEREKSAKFILSYKLAAKKA